MPGLAVCSELHDDVERGPATRSCRRRRAQARSSCAGRAPALAAVRAGWPSRRASPSRRCSRRLPSGSPSPSRAAGASAAPAGSSAGRGARRPSRRTSPARLTATPGEGLEAPRLERRVQGREEDVHGADERGDERSRDVRSRLRSAEARRGDQVASFAVDAVHDVVVVGAGCAGMRAAIEAFDAGADVAMVSKIHPVRSHSGAAEGGINAALGNASEDDPEKHAFDTVKGSDYLGDQDAIEILCQRGARRRLPARALGSGLLAQRPTGGSRSGRSAPPASRAPRTRRTSRATCSSTCSTSR